MSCQRFAIKVAIVTGSSSGIGQGIALLFAQQGANVTIHGLDLEEVQETYDLLIKNGVSKERLLMVAGDLCDPETCEKLVKETISKWGKLDVLVNNAGVDSKPGVLDSEENCDFAFDINVKAVIRMNKLAIPHLQKSKGNIVNTCSSVAVQRFRDIPTFYAMSKAALDHYIKYEAPRLAEMGIRMNNVLPGLVVTKFKLRAGWTEEAYEKVVTGRSERDIPLGRAGIPRDIAHVPTFYAMSKGALDHYIKYEAPRLAEMGIRMNNVAPGVTLTKIKYRVGFTKEAFEKLVTKFVETDVAMGRIGMPRDIAHAVSYLASEDASYVTGTTLLVDGGMLLGKA